MAMSQGGSSPQLLLQHHSCLPPAILPTIFLTPETVSSKLNSFFFISPGVAAIEKQWNNRQRCMLEGFPVKGQCADQDQE